jgi:hypothetical protein
MYRLLIDVSIGVTHSMPEEFLEFKLALDGAATLVPMRGSGFSWPPWRKKAGI